MNPETCPCSRLERRDDGTRMCLDCRTVYPDVGKDHNDALKVARALLAGEHAETPVSSNTDESRDESEQTTRHLSVVKGEDQ